MKDQEHSNSLRRICTASFLYIIPVAADLDVLTVRPGVKRISLSPLEDLVRNASYTSTTQQDAVHHDP